MKRIWLSIGFFSWALATTAAPDETAWVKPKEHMLAVLNSEILDSLLEKKEGHMIRSIELVQVAGSDTFSYLVTTGPLVGADGLVLHYAVTDLEFETTKNEDGSIGIEWVE
jgi:hypothetical protein